MKGYCVFATRGGTATVLNCVASSTAGPKRSKEEQSKANDALMHGVPPRVRAALSPEQQKKLQELIGDQFYQ